MPLLVHVDKNEGNPRAEDLLMGAKLDGTTSVNWNLSIPLGKKERLVSFMKSGACKRTPSELLEEKVDEELRRLEGQRLIADDVNQRAQDAVNAIARKLSEAGRATAWVVDEATHWEKTLAKEFPSLTFRKEDLLQRALFQVTGR